MSRELIGFAVIALACIIISPFYKGPVIDIQHKAIAKISEKKVVVKAKNSKSIILLSDSFLPTTIAGSELSAFETIRYLRKRGHNITIYVNEEEVEEYDGFKIYKYDLNDRTCKEAIVNCDLVFFQMGDDPKNLEIVKYRTAPVYVFIHLVDRYPWLLQQRMAFPISVVYNSNMTQDTLPTLHDNMRMVPYVETERFKALRTQTIQNDVVCLINCNQNKGGELFKELAYKMPDVQFLGVKGGYSNQVIDKNPPPNLKYIENQKDIVTVFRKIGILVMPSRNETWGRTAVEAMAAGVPVIHSEAPGLVECVGGAGIMCVHDDKSAWEDAIRRLVSDRAYRERIRQYGFKRVEEIQVEQTRGRQELAIKVEA